MHSCQSHLHCRHGLHLVREHSMTLVSCMTWGIFCTTDQSFPRDKSKQHRHPALTHVFGILKAMIFGLYKFLGKGEKRGRWLSTWPKNLHVYRIVKKVSVWKESEDWTSLCSAYMSLCLLRTKAGESMAAEPKSGWLKIPLPGQEFPLGLKREKQMRFCVLFCKDPAAPNYLFSPPFFSQQTTHNAAQ